MFKMLELKNISFKVKALDNKEEITILAEVVEWPEEIDENRAKEAQVRAERRLAMKDPNVNLQRAELALHRALTRQEVKQNKH